MRTIKFKIDTCNDELVHWKYVKREKVKGKWRYWYDSKSLKKDVKAVVDKVTKKINKTVESVKKKVHKYVAKVPTGGDTYRYFYSDEAYQAYSKGKTAVDELMKKPLNVKNQ